MRVAKTLRISAAARRIGLAALVVAIVPGGAWAPSGAAEQRYSAWPDPSRAGPGDDRVQVLIDALGTLVDEAERARAADPRLLRDLRDLARRFEPPWRVSVLSDDFADGDFTANPAWTVTQGRYWVEPGYGLRSTIARPRRRQVAPVAAGKKRIWRRRSSVPSSIKRWARKANAADSTRRRPPSAPPSTSPNPLPIPFPSALR